MALNDKRQTDKVYDAWKYFEELERNKEDMDTIEVNNSEMLEAALWASSFFSNPIMLEEIIKKLEKNNYAVPGTIHLMTAPSEVNQMVFSYVGGNRTFVKYRVNQAKKLCRALTQYVSILEKEEREKKIGELIDYKQEERKREKLFASNIASKISYN